MNATLKYRTCNVRVPRTGLSAESARVIVAGLEGPPPSVDEAAAVGAAGELVERSLPGGDVDAIVDELTDLGPRDSEGELRLN